MSYFHLLWSKKSTTFVKIFVILPFRHSHFGRANSLFSILWLPYWLNGYTAGYLFLFDSNFVLFVGNYLIQHALPLVLKESFKIYCAVNDGIIKLIDKFSVIFLILTFIISKKKILINALLFQKSFYTFNIPMIGSNFQITML